MMTPQSFIVLNTLYNPSLLETMSKISGREKKPLSSPLQTGRQHLEEKKNSSSARTTKVEPEGSYSTHRRKIAAAAIDPPLPPSRSSAPPPLQAPPHGPPRFGRYAGCELRRPPRGLPSLDPPSSTHLPGPRLPSGTPGSLRHP